MKIAHQKLAFLFSCVTLFSLTSCEKEEDSLPGISLKSGGNYIASDVTRPAGSAILIGIEAAKSGKDELKKFDISRAVNGGAPASLFSTSLSGTEAKKYSNDYTTTLEAKPGQVDQYIFTVTNRDGRTNQVAVKVTIK